MLKSKKVKQGQLKDGPVPLKAKEQAVLWFLVENEGDRGISRDTFYRRVLSDLKIMDPRPIVMSLCEKNLCRYQNPDNRYPSGRYKCLPAGRDYIEQQKKLAAVTPVAAAPKPPFQDLIEKLQGPEKALFDHAVSLMEKGNPAVLSADLQAWIKTQSGWSTQKLRVTVNKLKSSGILLVHSQGLIPITHFQ